MGAPSLDTKISYAQYLAHEHESEVKHAFHDGEIYAMAGGTRHHGAIALAFASELRGSMNAGACGCTVYNSDVRVSLRARHSMYPDAMVACPPIESPSHDADAVSNPVVILEVLSPTTADWDLAGKFELYREFTSLRHYLVAHADTWRVMHFERQADGRWIMGEHGAGSVIHLAALGVNVSVDAVYAGLVAQGGPARDAVPAPRGPRRG